MKINLRDTRNPRSFFDGTRKQNVFNLKLSTSLLLTIILCKQMLVMALPLPAISFNVASLGEDLDTVKSTGGVLEFQKFAENSFKDLQIEDLESLGTVKSTDDVLGSRKILDPVAGSSQNLEHFDSNTLEVKDFAKMDDGSDMDKKGLDPTSSIHKSESPGNPIAFESGRPKSSIFSNLIVRFKNWSIEKLQFFSDLIQRMKGTKAPFKDTLSQSTQKLKQRLGPVKTSVKPSRIELAKLVLNRYSKLLNSKYKNFIKGRAEKKAFRKQQKAVASHELAQEWFQSLQPPRSHWQ
ncbi:hypothetical protein DFH28DRAFT_1104372 [Melampsora americana]|nr:hypothetical protein DFH28DRAFT_1104372 [Melampsora americana]